MPSIRQMFHTQEKRDLRLSEPVVCQREDAWLGDGYYFWDDVDDAERWGKESKKQTGWYEIYLADIDCSNVLDTVFNEEHYRFWLRQVEKVADLILNVTNEKPTIREINAYFKQRGQWDNVAGILFQDIPGNPAYVRVKRFYYKKRIQIVVYQLDILTTFALLKEERC